MAAPVVEQWKYAQQLEGELIPLLTKWGREGPTFEQINDLINEYRKASESTIFLDFEYAVSQGVGQHLWDAHTKINNRFKKLLAEYRKGDQKKMVVEKRKFEKRYADFIKLSQFFYKGYIQRLASHFAGMKGLHRIANRLSLSTLSVDERIQPTAHVEHLIEMSCHATLLRLGDLSRYRNNMRTKDRSWDPAMAYYSLANDLYPDSGAAHNQMAVIATTDGNHLDAVYHFYRAIATKEPHPLAQGNLELEFKKIITSWQKKRPHPKTDSLTTLIWWFVLLHAKFYEGVDFSTHEELENEVLSRLALLLKEQSFGETLEKFVLINLASESLAGDRFRLQGDEAKPEIIKSYLFCLAFNVRMMFVLLQILLPELEDPASGEELPSGAGGSRPDRPNEKITAVAARVFPALRQYCVWLASGAGLILTSAGTASIQVHAKEMWKMYADVLTKLANFFPVEELASVSYLLEEDESTVGFQPLRNPSLGAECNLYVDDKGELKPRITDLGVKRDLPHVEMQARVLNILLCGLSLQLKEQIPLALSSDTGSPAFTFVEEGLSLTSPVRVQGSASSYTSPVRTNGNYGMDERVQGSASSYTSPVRTNGNHGMHEPTNGTSEVRDESVAASDSHQSMDTDMHRMVDSLLEPPSSRNTTSNETSYGMHSATANEVFAPMGSNGYEPRFHSTPKMLPSLPGFYNSAFTPQPNELQPLSPNRPMTARQMSPLPLATPEQRLQAAIALDEVTGYGPTKTGSWGRKASRPLSNPISQPVSQLLQESLAQQFMPMPSSAFSDSSSIYVNNTPQLQHRAVGGPLRGGLPLTNGNNSTVYPGASDFDKTTMLQSSIYDGSQPAWGGYAQTPPGGQGG